MKEGKSTALLEKDPQQELTNLAKALNRHADAVEKLTSILRAIWEESHGIHSSW